MKLHTFGRILQTAALASLATAAHAVTDIGTCQTINQSGSYRLTQNLVTSGNCLVINVSNVSIDLAGHHISGTSTSPLVSGVTIPSSRHGITNIEVRNGTIRNFAHGISLLDVHYARIENVRAIDNRADGILVSSSVVVRNSFVAGNRFAGIRIQDASIAPGYGGTITDNVVLLNGHGSNIAMGGIEVESVGALIARNQVRHNSWHGIAAPCPATVIDNSSTGNNTKGLGGVNLKLDGAGCLNKDNLSAQ